jgi:P27 family predicted phage terminase small subunit
MEFMAPRGKKPKPSHLKLVTGNPGKRPLPKNEPQPEILVPSVPKELCDDGKLEWGRVSLELYRLGLLSEIDRAALVAYCASYGLWVRTTRKLREMEAVDEVFRGLMIRSAKGNLISNPLIGIANKAAADVVRYAEQFGMTPSARARVNGEQGNSTKNNPLDKFTKD